MASQPVHEVEGGRRLRQTLKAAGDDLSDLKAVHKDAAEVAAARARTIVPVGVTGKLKATIRAAGTKTAGIVRVGNNTSVKYANPIHWGWYRRHIPDSLFASRAAQETEPTWLALYSNYIDRTLDQIKGT